MNRASMADLSERLTGNHEEGERITVRLLPVKDIHTRYTDMKLLTALNLYRQK